jgi:hypothetical protein
MKTAVISSIILCALMSCLSEKGKEARVSLKSYESFVDSISNVNDQWKLTNDTDFVESLVDVNTTAIDTIITLAKNKKTMVARSSGYHEAIMAAHNKVLKDVEKSLAELNDEMKRRFDASKQKFDALLVE